MFWFGLVGDLSLARGQAPVTRNELKHSEGPQTESEKGHVLVVGLFLPREDGTAALLLGSLEFLDLKDKFNINTYNHNQSTVDSSVW